MDHEYGGSSEEDPEAQAMAAAMGFSSFGTQKPATKKRKFNMAIDAYVEGDELASLDKGGKKGQGSGGNTVPLGKARAFGSSSTAIHKSAEQDAPKEKNQGEIDLQVSDDDDGPKYMDTSKAPPIESGNYEQRHAPEISQSPLGVSEEEAREVQARIDALLSSISTQQPDEGIHPLSRDQSSSRTFNDTSFMLGGPPPPSRNRFNDASSVATSSRPGEKSQRNLKWYVGYYDPSFNENPWKLLEEAKGLAPLGRWPDIEGARAVR